MTKVISLRISDHLHDQYRALPSVYRRALLVEIRNLTEKVLSEALESIHSGASAGSNTPLEKAREAVSVVSKAAQEATAARNAEMTGVSKVSETTQVTPSSLESVETQETGDASDGCSKIIDAF